MFQHPTTLTDYILAEERKSKQPTGSFTILMMQIQEAGKLIAHHVRHAGLSDILGKTGKINAFAEEVEKLDEYTDTVLTKTLLESGQVYAVASEEHPKTQYAKAKQSGNYIVFFDPLDGSSNIDVNAPLGTIFSIYHKEHGILPKGKDQIAAGYIIYGSSTMFVYASQYSINGFTFDPGVGSFLLSHPNITIPEKGNTFSVNEGNFALYDKPIQKYLSQIKQQGSWKARYIGTMVADIHRTILKGGIFLYPASSKHKNGKLRLLFEVNPISFIVEKTGGMAISTNKNPLEIKPRETSQQAPIVIGSKENVEEFLKITKI